jgi:tRNA(adenine34) deaminase
MRVMDTWQGGGPPDRDRDDAGWMDMALEEAQAAAEEGDVPVGAVVVRAGQLLARAHNRREALGDPTAHAEILALSAAARVLGGWRLAGTTVYVTLEPCPMCAGALVLARVERLVFGAADPKSGAVVSLYRLGDDARLNHRLQIAGGVRAAEASALLKQFFQVRRKPNG